MKSMHCICLIWLCCSWILELPAQTTGNILNDSRKKASPSQSQLIELLIGQYSTARETRDTVLLKRILMPDIDQLVSSGEWRTGIQSSVQGMLGSSAAAPGTRTLVVDRLRMIGAESAIVDCKYDIKNSDGSSRNMWSCFIVELVDNEWKIAAIRNMLPGKP